VTNPADVLSSHNQTGVVDGNKNAFQIILRDDLSINFLVKSVIIVIDVEFEEENTGVKARESRQVLLFPKGKHIINLDKKENFRPGFPFKIDATVSTVDGLSEKSESIPLTIKYKYSYEGRNGKNQDITTVSFLKKGAARFVLNPPEDAKGLELKVDYDGSTIEEKVAKVDQSAAEEFLQAVVMTEQ
jgi:hypothetical protein